MCSVHSLIITCLFQGCFLGAAPGSEEGKLNTHSKNRGGVGEPPVAWFQCVHQLAFTFWLTPPVISRLTLFYTLSFWLFFIFFSPASHLGTEFSDCSSLFYMDIHDSRRKREGEERKERRGMRIVSVSTQVFLFVSILILLDQGPILITSFKLYYLHISPISKFTLIET